MCKQQLRETWEDELLSIENSTLLKHGLRLYESHVNTDETRYFGIMNELGSYIFNSHCHFLKTYTIAYTFISLINLSHINMLERGHHRNTDTLPPRSSCPTSCSVQHAVTQQVRLPSQRHPKGGWNPVNWGRFISTFKKKRFFLFCFSLELGLGESGVPFGLSSYDGIKSSMMQGVGVSQHKSMRYCITASLLRTGWR